MTNQLSTKQWFYVASTDLMAARRLSADDMYPKLLDIACFHCQQAAEKALKGFLMSKDHDPPRIHDLQTLSELCIDLDPSFASILKTAVPLNRYITASRYPVESHITKTMTQTAIARRRRSTTLPGRKSRTSSHVRIPQRLRRPAPAAESQNFAFYQKIYIFL
jgi:HEPN domain-containing protein